MNWQILYCELIKFLASVHRGVYGTYADFRGTIWCQCCKVRRLHTVSFDWHLSGLEFNFDQTYLNTGSKIQNVEKLSLDMIFHNNFW